MPRSGCLALHGVNPNLRKKSLEATIWSKWLYFPEARILESLASLAKVIRERNHDGWNWL